MYPRNAASPPRIAVGAVTLIADGVVQTSGCSVVVRPEGGAEAAGSGTIAYSAASGIVYYTPTQAETDFTAFCVVAYKADCHPAAITVVTTASSVAGRTMPADGSITAAVIADNAIDTATFATGTTIPRVTLADTATTLANLPAITANWLTAAGISADAVTEIQSGLSTLTTSDVNAQVLDVLQTDTFAELGAPPAATSSLKDKLTWLFMWARNKSTQTATQRKLYADDTTTVVGTETVSDDATTYTKGEAS